MKEKAIIIFVASVLGLLITTIAFYIYQTTKPAPTEREVQNPIAKKSSPQAPKINSSLIIQEPADESVVDRRTVGIKGKAEANNTIVVSSNFEDVVGKVSSDGNFALSVDIEAGVNKIITRSINTSGEVVLDERIVTYTTEEF